jgi:hypothetical protein
MARRIVPRKRGATTDANGPLTINLHGGAGPGVSEVTTYLTVISDSGRPRRVRVLGGLPDELAGNRMTDEERTEYDNRVYNAVFGGPLKAPKSPDDAEQGPQ